MVAVWPLRRCGGVAVLGEEPVGWARRCSSPVTPCGVGRSITGRSSITIGRYLSNRDRCSSQSRRLRSGRSRGCSGHWSIQVTCGLRRICGRSSCTTSDRGGGRRRPRPGPPRRSHRFQRLRDTGGKPRSGAAAIAGTMWNAQPLRRSSRHLVALPASWTVVDEVPWWCGRGAVRDAGAPAPPAACRERARCAALARRLDPDENYSAMCGVQPPQFDAGTRFRNQLVCRCGRVPLPATTCSAAAAAVCAVACTLHVAAGLDALLSTLDRPCFRSRRAGWLLGFVVRGYSAVGRAGPVLGSRRCRQGAAQAADSAWFGSAAS